MTKKEMLEKYGFNQEQINKILSSYIIKKISIETFENYLINIFEYESKYFSKKEIIKQITRNPSLIAYSHETLEEHRKNFRNLYSDEEINSMYKKEAKLQSISKEKYDSQNNLFLRLNYSITDIKKLFLTLPQLYNYSENQILKRRNLLENLNYKQKDINKMSILFPQIYSLSDEHITRIIKYLVKNNYTEEEIHTITTSFPTIFSKNENKIENTKALFIELGFTAETFKYIFIKCPSIISYDQDNLRNKIIFFIENKEIDFLLENPNHLKQSSTISYARKFFLEVKGINLSANNFKLIFIADRDFKKKFNVTKDDVIKQYKKVSKWDFFVT